MMSEPTFEKADQLLSKIYELLSDANDPDLELSIDGDHKSTDICIMSKSLGCELFISNDSVQKTLKDSA